VSDKKFSEFADGTPAQSSDVLLVARGSDNYRLAVSEISPIPQLPAQTVLASTDLYTLSGGTKVLVAGVPGKIIVPYLVQYDKAAGIAYTLNSVSRINVCVASATGTVLAFSLTAGMMDQAAAKNDYSVHPGSATGGYTAALTAAGTGASLVAGRLGGTDLSAGTGDLTITIFYRLISIPASLIY